MRDKWFTISSQARPKGYAKRYGLPLAGASVLRVARIKKTSLPRGKKVRGKARSCVAGVPPRELTSQLNAVNSKANSATSIAQAASNKLPPVPVIKDLSEIQNLSAENNRLRRQLESQQSDLNGYRVALNNFQASLPTKEDKFIDSS